MDEQTISKNRGYVDYWRKRLIHHVHEGSVSPIRAKALWDQAQDLAYEVEQSS